MSNFLDNLVARTLKLAPVVQPRLQTRFEPVSPVGAAVAEESVEIEAPVPAQPPAIARPKPSVVERERVERVESQRVINTIRNTHVQTHEVRQVSVPVVEKIREREIERLSVIEPRIHTEKTDSRIEIRENPILVTPPKDIEKNPLNPRLNKSEPAPVRKEAPVTTPVQAAVPPVVTRIEPAPTVKPQRFEVQPVFQPEPTETINVTIGRVDVRAVFSAQASKTPVRNAATNSLDDYLKQRSEGRR
jgi:hypothetical protein